MYGSRGRLVGRNTVVLYDDLRYSNLLKENSFICEFYEVDLLVQWSLFVWWLWDNMLKKDSFFVWILWGRLVEVWSLLYDGYEVDLMEKYSCFVWIPFICKFKYHKIVPMMHGPSDLLWLVNIEFDTFLCTMIWWDLFIVNENNNKNVRRELDINKNWLSNYLS